MAETIIYLIRHAETIDENVIRYTNETFQEINENLWMIRKQEILLVNN